MLFLLFCCFAICGFLSAILVGSTIFCLLLAIGGAIMLATAFSCMGLLLLSSVSLLAYAGIFIILFLISRKYLPDDIKKLKTILIFILGLFITIILCHLIFNDSNVYNIGTDPYESEQTQNLIIIGLIILVGILAGVFSKYDFSVDIRKKQNTDNLTNTKDPHDNR